MTDALLVIGGVFLLAGAVREHREMAAAGLAAMLWAALFGLLDR